MLSRTSVVFSRSCIQVCETALVDVDVDVDAIAGELYGLPLADFTGARNGHSRRARTDGQAELARQIQALRKPTTAAWLVNQLTRRYADEVNVLLDLGHEMRAGMAGVSGDELRLLTRRRHELISALVRRAMSVGGSGRISNDVEADVRSTLEATLSDPQSADAVVGGRLHAPLSVSGFGFGGPEGGASNADSAPAGADVVDLDDRRNRRTRAMEKAEAAIAAAEKDSRKAHDRREKAEAKVRAAEEDGRLLAETVARIREELENASARLEDHGELVRRKQEKLTEADDAARQADRALAGARESLRRLTR